MSLMPAQALADVAEQGPVPGPVLVELFTSQACSSCPPAEAVFRDLAARDDLVVIEWHVDYWNRLSHGRDGSWADPYSAAAHTERQRDYNIALRGLGSVYTPQAVVNGRSETTGSRGPAIERLIAGELPPAARLAVSPGRVMLMPASRAVPADTGVYVVTLLPQQATDVQGGENSGRHLESRNVAVGFERVGTWTGRMTSIALPEPADGLACAVIVQDMATMQVLGASYCAPKP